jgi:hypothetical protein
MHSGMRVYPSFSLFFFFFIGEREKKGGRRGDGGRDRPGAFGDRGANYGDFWGLFGDGVF